MYLKTDGFQTCEAYSIIGRTNVMQARLRREILWEEKLLKIISVLGHALETQSIKNYCPDRMSQTKNSYVRCDIISNDT